MNQKFNDEIKQAPETKAKRIVNLTADFAAVVVDMLPSGKPSWRWVVLNAFVLFEIGKLTWEFVNDIKKIINE
jgi:hypothetical protein